MRRVGAVIPRGFPLVPASQTRLTARGRHRLIPTARRPECSWRRSRPRDRCVRRWCTGIAFGFHVMPGPHCGTRNSASSRRSRSRRFTLRFLGPGRQLDPRPHPASVVHPGMVATQGKPLCLRTVRHRPGSPSSRGSSSPTHSTPSAATSTISTRLAPDCASLSGKTSRACSPCSTGCPGHTPHRRP